MFVYTVTKKRAFRMALVVLAVFVGIAVGIAAILTAVSTSASESKLPIYSVDRGDNKIALTFDCAWGNSNTDELLNILANAGAKATFFVTGEFAEKYPEDVRKFAAAGHEIANHSDLHPHVKGLNIADLIADTKSAAAKIKLAAGSEPTLYRSPYGEYDNNAVTTVEGMGYRMIQWSVDSLDWKEPDAATIIKRVLDQTNSGSILLFHNDLANTTQALPDLLTALTKKGYTFEKVSDLIYHDDYYLDSTGKQIYDVKVESGLITFSNNRIVNEALNIIQSNLTFDELAELKNGISGQVALKVGSLLTKDQIKAMNQLTAADYVTAWNAMMSAYTKQTSASPNVTANIADSSGNSGNETAVPDTTITDLPEIPVVPGTNEDEEDTLAFDEGAELEEEDNALSGEGGEVAGNGTLSFSGIEIPENIADLLEAAQPGAGNTFGTTFGTIKN